MPRGLIKGLGLVLLLATIGVVSCQALFAAGSPADRLPPAAAERL
jgi:hypothetical protein